MSVNPFIPTQAINNEVSLSSLRKGSNGYITRIDQPELEIALLKMGVTVGDRLILTGAAPLHGPIAIRAGHVKLSLRSEDASHIWINQR